MRKGPNSAFGRTGRTTAVSRRNIVKVRISSDAIRLVSPSSADFSSSRNAPETLSAVAIQIASRATSAPAR